MEQTHDSPTALELYKGHPVQEAAQIILGSLLFSASMNWIILPHDMYSGGFLGIAQLLRMLLLHFFPAIQQIGDLAGILYFLLNIPLLLIEKSQVLYGEMHTLSKTHTKGRRWRRCSFPNGQNME